MLPLAASQYERQRRRARLAVLLARREWGSMVDDLDAGWAKVGPRLTVLVAAAQLGAATDGAAWVDLALAAQRQSVKPDALVNPRAFMGLASDGRPLASLLYGAVVHARTAQVDSLAQRLLVGRGALDTLVAGQVADASRDASAVAITARPRVQWVRIVNPPCCQRCAVLAGRVYSHSHGFERHPQCDCSMFPQTVANPDAVGVVIGPGDVKDLNAAQRQAIADGADFNRTINAAQPKRKRGAFLSPTRVDQITARAATRDDAVQALTQAGYLAP